MHIISFRARKSSTPKSDMNEIELHGGMSHLHHNSQAKSAIKGIELHSISTHLHHNSQLTTAAATATMAQEKVIVFGATGQVGARTAIRAQALGAKVSLAVRNKDKPIRGLSHEEETKAGFQRVQADLTDAASVTQAIQATGATRAFVYIPLGPPGDDMKATFEALKAAGVVFVVCLSADTLSGDLEAVPPAQYISYRHARAEINMGASFGADGVAVRAGHFTSNVIRYKAMLAKGEVHCVSPNAAVDWLDPEDVGDVCGTVLVQGGKGPLSVRGPDTLNQRDALLQIASVLGRQVDVTEADEAQALYLLTELNGFPEPVARQVMNTLAMAPTDADKVKQEYAEATANVDRYSGHKATTLRQWVEKNRAAFDS